MIYEYAVDPDTLRDWKVFRHLADGFGASRGRLILRYPKDWLRLAYQVVAELDDNAKKRFETWLADRARKAMTEPRAGAQPFTVPTWFHGALAEYHRERFHAIIAEQPASIDPPVLRFSDIDSSQPLWNISTQQFIARNAAVISQHAAPLLAHAKVIRFIDPYFMGDPDQVAILIACLGGCVQRKAKITSVELHVDGGKIQPVTEAHLLGAIGRKWPASLPAIKVVRWNPEYLHDRFILMDRGGIMFGDSLRQHQTRPDQMTLMEEKVRQKWWDYHDALINAAHVCKPGQIV